MYRRLKPLALAMGLLFTGAGYAQDNQLESDLRSVWEVMWHQSGQPVQISRWNEDIRVQFVGGDPALDHDEIMDTLHEVAKEAGVNVVEDFGSEPNVTIEVVANDELQDNEPCRTTVETDDEFNITSATVQFRQSDVHRCTHHEFMHLMGLKGHPSGATVLSYFAPAEDRIFPLDKAMLHALYSKDMKPGMNALQAFPVFADELACAAPNRTLAIATRDNFYINLLGQMYAFALGKGDIPAIVRKSGKATKAGVKIGRAEMTQFLTESLKYPSSSALQCKSAVS